MEKSKGLKGLLSSSPIVISSNMAISTSPPSDNIFTPFSDCIYTASDYQENLKKKRLAYVQKYFEKEFLDLFAILKKKSNNYEECNEKFSISVDRELDIKIVEERIIAFLNDCGYKVFLDPRKDPSRTLVFTITVSQIPSPWYSQITTPKSEDQM